MTKKFLFSRAGLLCALAAVFIGSQPASVAAQAYERIAADSMDRVSAFGGCRYVTNNNSSDAFVALSTQTEWNSGTAAFLTEVPPNVTVQTCGLEFRKVLAIEDRFCGITLDGDSYCWGAKPYPKSADGYTINYYTNPGIYGRPTKMNFPDAKDLVVTNFSMCVLSLTNRIYCGNGVAAPALSPVTGMVSIKSGDGWLCGETTSKDLRCWGGKNENILFPATDVTSYHIESSLYTKISVWISHTMTPEICWVDVATPKCAMLDLQGLLRVGKESKMPGKASDCALCYDEREAARPWRKRFYSPDGFGNDPAPSYDYDVLGTVKGARGVPGNIKKTISVGTYSWSYIKADGTVGRTAWSDILDIDGNISNDTIPSVATIRSKGIYNYQDTTPGTANNLVAGFNNISGPALDAVSTHREYLSGVCVLNDPRTVTCLEPTTSATKKIYRFDIDLKSIASNGFTVCGLDLNNGLWCQGDNDKAQLGQGNTTASSGTFLIR